MSSHGRQRTRGSGEDVGNGRLPAAGDEVVRLFGNADNKRCANCASPGRAPEHGRDSSPDDSSRHAIDHVLRPIGAELRQHGHASVMFATRVTPSVPR